MKDRTNNRGLWLKWFDARTMTRLGSLWSNLNARIRGNSNYLNCANEFPNFQFFGDWCMSQEGYSCKDLNGNSWALDKDILGKNYSEATCCFVPQYVNSLLTLRGNFRGEYPLGVDFLERNGKYRSRVNGANDSIYLGLYENPKDAHRAWQLEKAAQIENTVKRYSEEPSGFRGDVAEALLKRVNNLKQDFAENKETIYI